MAQQNAYFKKQGSLLEYGKNLLFYFFSLKLWKEVCKIIFIFYVIWLSPLFADRKTEIMRNYEYQCFLIFHCVTLHVFSS